MLSISESDKKNSETYMVGITTSRNTIKLGTVQAEGNRIIKIETLQAEWNREVKTVV